MKLVVEKKIKGFGKGIDGFILFMEWYETQSNRTVDGQDYIGLALQEIYPQAKIYDMNKLNLVPTKLYVKFNLQHVDAGSSTRAGDFLIVEEHRAGTFDAKTKEDKEKSVGGNEIARKKIAWDNLTNLDFFGIASDSVKGATRNTKKDIPNLVYLDRDDLFNLDIYDKIYDRIVGNWNITIRGQLATLRPNHPFKDWGPDFSQQSLDQLKKDFKALKQTKSNIRILNNAPAGSGKTERWIVEYYEVYRDVSRGTTNIVETHNTTVLKNNLNTFVKDAQARGVSPEILLFTDKKNPIEFASPEEEYFFNTYCKTLHNGIDFNKWLRESFNHERWIFVLNQSYTKLYNILCEEEVEINFQFIDEVHHTVQPYWADWATPLLDPAKLIKTLCGASANYKEIDDNTNGLSPNMDLYGTWDIKTLECSEEMAVGFGWKRQTKPKPYVYDLSQINSSHLKPFINEITNKKKVPYITLVGYGHAVPTSYLVAADAIIQYKIDHQDRKYTLGTMNKLANCREFKKFFEFYKKIILQIRVANGTLSKNSKIYTRLVKMHIKVADTDNYDTSKYLKEVENIPGEFDDALILHCRLLGEGWSPKNGWIDSTVFIDPAYSKIRIYQFNERGARKATTGYETNHMILFKVVDGKNDSVGFNNLYQSLYDVCEILGIGTEIIKEIETFLMSKGTKGKGGGGVKGGNPNTFLLSPDAIYSGYINWIRNERHYLHYDIAEESLNYLLKRTKELKNNHFFMFTDRSFYQLISDELYVKYKHNFTNKDLFKVWFLKFRSGEHAPTLRKLATDCAVLREQQQQDLIKRDRPIVEQLIVSGSKKVLNASFLTTTGAIKDYKIDLYNQIKKQIKFDMAHAPTACNDNNWFFSFFFNWLDIDPNSYFDIKKMQKEYNLMLKNIRKDADELYSSALDKDPNYMRGFTDRLVKKYNLPQHQINSATSDIRKKWMNNSAHWVKQKRKVYKLIIETAEKSVGKEEWFENVASQWTETKIQGSGFYGKIPGRLLSNFWGVLNKKEFEVIKQLRAEVKTRAYKARPYDHDPWNKNLKKKNPKKYNEWCTAVQKGRDKKYKKDKVIS